MPGKRVICPERVRKVPAQFSWVDHRLVRERHIERCDPYAAALRLFLVTVADAQGLSYYSDASLARRLSMDASRLNQARADLIRKDSSPMTRRCIKCWPWIRRRPAKPPSRRRTKPMRVCTSYTRFWGSAVIDYETYCKIKDYHDRQQLTVGQIANALALHPRTVAKWVSAAQYCRRASALRASRLDPFKAQVARWLETHPYSAQQDIPAAARSRL